jgi:hypothetical protein
LSIRGKHVRDGDAATFDCARQDLRIDAIRLAPMRADPELTDACRIDENDLVTVAAEDAGDVPSVATRFESDARSEPAFSTQDLPELADAPAGRASDDTTFADFANGVLPRCQIHSYAPHR